jgi:uncharacterized protein (TIGR03437 family)
VRRTLPTASAGVVGFVKWESSSHLFRAGGPGERAAPIRTEWPGPGEHRDNYNGAASTVKQVQLSASAPRLYPGIFSEDGSSNSPSNPAPAGSIVVLYATGQGVSGPLSRTGGLPVAPYPSPADLVRVTVGGEDAEILFASLAPATAGILQLNLWVPDGIAGRHHSELQHKTPTATSLPICGRRD